ncbi:MAG: tRNA uracil 4-sulfurtransferase ThiI [Chloroflexota bacterium]|nr:tRNA uracil 4-sulfurtransferase ThiI [Chloroflexota bacterium]
MQYFLVHYGELGLKGRNRPDFEKRLTHNMWVALDGLAGRKVKRFHGYMVVGVDETVPSAEVEWRLAAIFGIAYFAPVLKVAQEMAAIREAALHLAREVLTAETSFAVNTRRADKSFLVHSMEVNRVVGADIVAATGAPVNLDAPDVTVDIQIYRDGVYVFDHRVAGAGGLPVGTGGRVMTLLSGGIDSPVAAHLLMKRGCLVDFVHLHLLRDNEVRNSKVIELARTVLGPHRLPANLYLAPAHPFQLAMLGHDSRVELVVFRRFILRLAAKLAQRRKALALVTGDNLGQVASQTLKNLQVTGLAVEMPVLRPLISFDKQEIITLAKKIGTYELSIQPYKDPCSLQAKNPATWARLEEVLALEKQLDLEAVMAETLEKLVEVRIEW